MKKKLDLRNKFWQDLVQKVEEIPGAKSCVKKLRENFSAIGQGEQVIYLKEGPTYQKALDMLATDVEFMSLDAKLELLDERRVLKRKEFWHSVFEETGIDQESGFYFDPIHLRIVSRRRGKKTTSDSQEVSLDRYKDILVKALYSPLNASWMAKDPYFGFSEIKQMAKAIIDGDFKPNLRKMIEEWMEDPIQAKESLPVLLEENMPEWLVNLAKRLGQRRKWS